jgi:hypothetical protein
LFSGKSSLATGNKLLFEDSHLGITARCPPT